MAHSEDGPTGSPTLTPGALGFGRLFDHIRDAVVVSDADGRIWLWNEAATRVFGYGIDEVRGRNVRMLVPERMREQHDEGMQRFRESGSGPLIRAGVVLELPALRKDGTEIVVEMTLSLLAENGNVMAIVRDVTDRVRLRAAADADRRHLREANEALESFSYVVGHDLKEPVRAVDVYLDALAEHVRGPEAEHALERARSANARMGVLLNGLIEWSRATLGPLDLHAIDVRDVLRGACSERYHRVLEERGGRLEFVGDFPHVQATEGLLCQVFGNLVLNALLHNPRPHPRVVVEALGEESGLVTIAVRDNGPGFPPEVRQRIERMRATRPTTVRGGFGMTIALRAAHLLGGRIDVGNAAEGGGEVRVHLRAAQPR